MKTLILATLTLFAVNVSAQKANIDKLPEKERNEYLLKTAYEVVMKHAPEWYRDYKEPEITSFMDVGGEAGDGRLRYYVYYFYDPHKEKLNHPFSVSVGIWADTGEPSILCFGDGMWHFFLPRPNLQARSNCKV